MRRIKLPAFTFIEVIMVMGIFAVIVTLVGVITFRAMNKRQANSEIEMLLAALSFQQQQAVNRLLSTETTQQYGVYFFGSGYTVFPGSSYVAGHASNRTTNLPPGVVFSTISLPNNQVVFDEATGFVQNYEAARSSVVVINQAGEQSLLTINRLGVVEVTK